MSQDKIIKILEKNKGKFLSSKEINNSLKIGQSAVSNSLRVLVKSNEIEQIKTKERWYHMYKYRIK